MPAITSIVQAQETVGGQITDGLESGGIEHLDPSVIAEKEPGAGGRDLSGLTDLLCGAGLGRPGTAGRVGRFRAGREQERGQGEQGDSAATAAAAW